MKKVFLALLFSLSSMSVLGMQRVAARAAIVVGATRAHVAAVPRSAVPRTAAYMQRRWNADIGRKEESKHEAHEVMSPEQFAQHLRDETRKKSKDAKEEKLTKTTDTDNWMDTIPILANTVTTTSMLILVMSMMD